MRHWRPVTAALLCLCQPAAAQTASQNFQIADARPAEQREDDSYRISRWVWKCSFGIYRVGDPKGSPGKLDVLRADLETQLGDTLKGKTLTVSNYGLYLNSSNRQRGNAFTAGLFGGLGGALGGALGGLLGASAQPEMGSGCSQEETPEGWYNITEISGGSLPLIVQLTATLDGKSYSVRVVQSLPGDDLTPSDDPINAYAPILHRANQALADKISGRIPMIADLPGSAPQQTVFGLEPATAPAKRYATMLPLGIGSASAVKSSSLIAANFSQDPHGVAVAALEAGGTAERAGIRPGDVITEIGGARIDSLGDLQASVARASGSDVDIQLNRAGKVMGVEVHL